MIKLNIPIAPVPASRPRFRKNGHTYDTKKYRDFKRAMSYWLSFNYKGKPLSGKPLSIRYEFYRDIQSSLSKKEHVKRAKNEVLPVVKPDVDNYVKSIQDCLIGPVLVDDNVITDIHAIKRYAEQPHIVVEITELVD